MKVRPRALAILVAVAAPGAACLPDAIATGSDLRSTATANDAAAAPPEGDDAAWVASPIDAARIVDAAVDPGCIAPGTPPGDGHHNAGAACLGCHVAGGEAAGFPWTVSGTLYASGGGAAIAGATIEVVGADGETLRLVTATNGNFYTGTAVAFPLAVRASACPSDASMVGPAQSGDCNGCHGGSMRVHLP
jgi:hypothetical protein